MPASSPDNPSHAPGTPGLTPSILAFLRLALLGSSVVFGIIGWWLVRNGLIVPQ